MLRATSGALAGAACGASIETCRRAFESKLWRRDLETWDTVDRPRAVSEHLKLQAIDPANVSDPELTAHLRTMHRHVEAMVRLHHRLAHALDWTGASAGEALALLAGTSPISRGVAAAELTALAVGLRDGAAAQQSAAR